MLEENTIEIAYADCWEHIFSNIHGIDFFFRNTDKLIEYNYDPSWDTDDYDELINFIIGEGMSKICKNPNVIYLINKDVPDILHIHNGVLVYWNALSSNPNAIHLLKANQAMINWSNLSKNPNAIHLLKANKAKINWSKLSKNPNAIELLKANKNKIDWSKLSKNPNAIHLLEANQDKIDWSNIYRNPSIFHRKPMPIY